MLSDLIKSVLMKLQHDIDNKRFFIPLGNSNNAELKYRLLDDDSVDFFSTFVPTSERGNGYASSLVMAALKWAKAEKKDIHASCWYVRDYIKHKQSS